MKASDKLSIPLKLDMASILAMAGAQPLQMGTYKDAQYELMSILIHKGPSASHGHYGALHPLLSLARFCCNNPVYVSVAPLPSSFQASIRSNAQLSLL